MIDDTVFSAGVDWYIPIGTPAYTQQTWHMTQGSFLVIGGVGGIMQANWGEKSAMLLLYLSQIWQWTAGMVLASAALFNQPLIGTNTVSPNKGYFRYIDIAMSSLSQPIKSWGSGANAAEYGWIQFTSQTFGGKLHKIQSPSSRIFPEADGFDGFNYVLLNGASASANYFFYDPSTAGVDIGNGTQSNPLADLVMQLPNPSYDTVAAAETDNPAITVPTIQSAKLVTVALGRPPERSVEGLTTRSDYTNWCTLLALANEAWNATAGRIYEDNNADVFNYSAEATKDYAAAFIRAVRITVVPPVPTGTAYQYSAGFPKYGLIGFRHDTKMSDIIPINALKSKFLPPSAYTNGLWIMPAPGVTLEVQYATAGDIVKGMFTVQGQVNLVKGVVSGLTGLA